MYCKSAFHPWVASAAFILLLVGGPGSVRVHAQNNSPATSLGAAAGITGGLCVMVGCDDSQSAVELAGTGRYLVHILDWDKSAIDEIRAKLQKMGFYGLASAELLGTDGKLPYTENLVNVVFLGDKVLGRIPLREIVRVLRPDGVLLSADQRIADADLAAAGLSALGSAADGSAWKRGKPWPAGMDQWSHPRHAADGNAVSHDQLVGPPRRIRWVTGPQQEISNMVTAGGRSFFAGVLARDAFNGLRLWESRWIPRRPRGIRRSRRAGRRAAGRHRQLPAGGDRPEAARPRCGDRPANPRVSRGRSSRRRCRGRRHDPGARQGSGPRRASRNGPALLGAGCGPGPLRRGRRRAGVFPPGRPGRR